MAKRPRRDKKTSTPPRPTDAEMVDAATQWVTTQDHSALDAFNARVNAYESATGRDWWHEEYWEADGYWDDRCRKPCCIEGRRVHADRRR